MSEQAFDRLLDALVEHGDQSVQFTELAAKSLGRAAGGGPESKAAAEEARALLFAAAEARRAQLAETDRNFGPYSDLHQVSMGIWFVALFAVEVALLTTLGLSPAWALLLFLPGSLYFGFNRSDLPVTTFLMLALLLQIRGRHIGAAVSLALAGMFKWFPLFLFPLFLAHGLHGERARRRAAGEDARWLALLPRFVLAPAFALGAVCLAILSITWFWDGGGWEAVRFLADWHLEREHNHSSLAAILCHRDAWAAFPPASLPDVKHVFLALQLFTPLALACFPLRSSRALLQACLVAVAGMALFSKFFSPQWVVWLVAVAIPLVSRARLQFVLVVALQFVIYLQLPVFVYEELDARMSDPYNGTFWTVTQVRLVLFAVIWVTALVAYLLELRRQRL
jgi:hypothetical protein